MASRSMPRRCMVAGLMALENESDMQSSLNDKSIVKFLKYSRHLGQQLRKRHGRWRLVLAAADQAEGGCGQRRQAVLAIDDDHVCFQVALRQRRHGEARQHRGPQALLAR